LANQNAALPVIRRVHRPETLTDAVIRHIREAVVRGDLPPGSALPEVQLATQMQTSRGTVREALRALQDLGLIEIQPHRGAFVTDMSIRRAREVLALRAVVEGYAARLAVEDGRMTPAAIATLESQYLMMLEASANDEARAIDAHLEFHSLIARLGGSELIADLLERLQLQTRRIVAYTAFLGAGDAAGHQAIVKAMRSGSAEASENVVRDHILHSGALVLARIAEMQAQGEDRG
jgi:DNA-binding GntR family transcriptional regulator